MFINTIYEKIYLINAITIHKIKQLNYSINDDNFKLSNKKILRVKIALSLEK